MGSIGSGRELRPTPPLSAPGRLVIAKPIPLDRCPAAVYLAQLKQSSRRPQKQALDLAASILTSGSADCLTLDWSVVRYQHTAAVRARLLDGYAPATANRILSAVRGVLEQAWLLGQMSAEDYHRAARLRLLLERRFQQVENCWLKRSPRLFRTV
jgi:hypothetical protein